MELFSADELRDVYTDLHAHPELSFQETRTAAAVAQHLRRLGFQVTEDIGGTGVVGVLECGDGPCVLLRADMDGLPVEESTGLAYASRERAVDRRGEDVPVMHACGHDVHVTCLLGACARLSADRDQLSGRVLAVFQPAEELGAGARAMVDDGLFDRFGRPDVVLGQHVAPLPAGVIGIHAGLAMANSDSLTVTLVGRGGHGSQPQATVDPIVLAAATVMRLQTIVSRETAATEAAVVTVGMIHAGTNNNIIPETAELRLIVRTTDGAVRDRTLAAIRRIVAAEAAASGADAPVVDHTDFFPALLNDDAAVDTVRRAFEGRLGDCTVVDIGTMTGSEDVGVFAEEAGAPCAFWFLGGADPDLFRGALTLTEILDVVRGLPVNHSANYAPTTDPTLEVGVQALVTAARAWLCPTDGMGASDGAGASDGFGLTTTG